MAGSVTQGSVVNVRAKDGQIILKTLTFSWIADASDGSVPNTAFSAANLAQLAGWKLMMIETDPGAVAPTPNYDIAINDDLNLDILGAAGQNRHTSNSERARPLIGTTVTDIPIDASALTLVISGNSINSATGTIKLYFVK